MTEPSQTGTEPDAPVEPIEIPWRTGVVRGYRWQGDRNMILLLHEPGVDLDVWGDLPALLAGEGYTVIAIDLPGHGLSDDPWEPGAAAALVQSLTRFCQTAGAARCFVIAAGMLSSASLVAGGTDALVALSPTPLESPPIGPTPPTLVLVGGGDADAVRAADRFFRDSRGWTVVSSFGTAAQSTALYLSDWGDHAFEQTVAFLNDYRMDDG